MDNGAILNIRALADFDIIYIAAQGAAIPDTAIRADFNITNNGCVFGDERVFVNFRKNFSVRRNNRHVLIL